MNRTEEFSGPTVLYLSHGGGPLPLLGDEGHKEMVDVLQNIASIIAKPSAILLISAHWEEREPTITYGAKPPLIYDYYGFSAQSYEIQYPAPGNPVLARKIYSLLRDNGIKGVLDDHRGFDHGLFVPLQIMYPQGDIPCVQLSLVNSLDPIAHINMGEALSGIEQEGLLVIGSGFSFHNMRAFFTPATTESQSMNESFEEWLVDTCSNHEISESERTRRLENWVDAPSARFCHPREEHLLPLHVCYGIIKQAYREVFKLMIIGKKASMYLW
jgi:4,5-DOPA dioxygenase extradiol